MPITSEELVLNDGRADFLEQIAGWNKLPNVPVASQGRVPAGAPFRRLIPSILKNRGQIKN